MRITKDQIRLLLKQFYVVYEMQQEMSKTLKAQKTFALDGRIIGDVGECLAGYLFDIDIEEKQTPGQDGTYRQKPVEIKTRTLKNNKFGHIHLSEATVDKPNGCYLILLSFDFIKHEINIEINTWMSKDILEDIKHKRSNGFIPFNKLKACLGNNCYAKGINVNKTKKQRISNWTIQYKEAE